jgi:hypothetical protein
MKELKKLPKKVITQRIVCEFCSLIDPSFIFAHGDSFEKGKSVFWALKREFWIEF